ncbi:MAG: hypothetical protein ACM37W_08180 [Actinomycetota bacterium]
MRLWQFWWQTLIRSSQSDPPRFIELVMFVLATLLLAVWSVTEEWPYLVLCLSYGIGLSSSVLVREAIAPSPQIHLTQATAVLLLLVSFYSFAELVR